MEFEVGRKYLTRGGELRSYVGKAPGDHSHPYVFCSDGGERLLRYASDGSCHISHVSCDIVGPAPLITGTGEYETNDGHGNVVIVARIQQGGWWLGVRCGCSTRFDDNGAAACGICLTKRIGDVPAKYLS